MAVEATRWFLAVFFSGVAVFYTARIVLATRHRGVSPVFRGDRGSVHFRSYLAFRVFRVAIWAVAVARLADPRVDPLIGPFYGLWAAPVLLVGNLLLLGAFAAVLVVNLRMGRDWWSGTRPDADGPLITTGPFAWTRNPMMLAVQAGQVGLFMALPSVFTLVCLGVGLWAVRSQVAVEEAALAARHGDAYAAYAARTPRWVFR